MKYARGAGQHYESFPAVIWLMVCRGRQVCSKTRRDCHRVIIRGVILLALPRTFVIHEAVAGDYADARLDLRPRHPDIRRGFWFDAPGSMSPVARLPVLSARCGSSPGCWCLRRSAAVLSPGHPLHSQKLRSWWFVGRRPCAVLTAH